MKDILSDFRTAIVTHSVFVVLNILIVITGVMLPRYINNPKIEIESARAIIDEEELEIIPEDRVRFSNLIYNGLIPRGINDPCLNAVEYGRIPSICFDVVGESLEKAKSALSRRLATLNDAISQYQELEYLPPEALAEKISGIDKRDYYSETFLLEALVLEGYAKEEYKNLYINTIIRIISNALTESRVQVNKDQTTIDSVLSQIDLEGGAKLKRSGDVVFDVTVSNKGHADAVIPANAILRLDGQSIPLKIRLEGTIGRIYGVAQEYGIVRAGSVLLVTYGVDQVNLTLRAKSVLDNSIFNRSTAEYQIRISIDGKEVSFTGNLPVESESIEYRNSEF